MIEDVEPTDAAREAVARFGPAVLAIVEACTKIAGDSLASKREYVARIRTEPASVVLVSASDKLHNARSIVADQYRTGPAVFTRFNVGHAETLAYYRGLVLAFRANPASKQDLVDELDRVVTEMERLASARQRGSS